MKLNSKASCVIAIFVILFLMIYQVGSIHVYAMDFSDNYQIGQVYSEAIISMTEQGILAGFPDNSFRPHETLTREQAAKIVVYLVIGEETASTLTCNYTPYSDVEISRWSAPYITWCSTQGILNGYGDGTFGPADKLTGIQFAKMLLCAFHGESGGRYIGSSWAEAVCEDGEQFGLFIGDEAMCSHMPLQRQQAALMAYNTIHEPHEESYQNQDSTEESYQNQDSIQEQEDSNNIIDDYPDDSESPITDFDQVVQNQDDYSWFSDSNEGEPDDNF